MKRTLVLLAVSIVPLATGCGPSCFHHGAPCWSRPIVGAQPPMMAAPGIAPVMAAPVMGCNTCNPCGTSGCCCSPVVERDCGGSSSRYLDESSPSLAPRSSAPRDSDTDNTPPPRRGTFSDR